MSRKFTRKVLLQSLALLGAAASSLALADVSSLIVVRASNDSLWKATCVGSTCSAFTNFPGFFGSQPAVTWDDSVRRYVLMGTAANGTVWRSTFDADGVFNNDWVQLPGLAGSPPGMAAGGVTRQYNSINGSSGGNVTLSTSPKDTPVNIRSLSFTPPLAQGFYQCTGTAMASFWRTNNIGDNVVFFGLSETSATLSNSEKWVAIDLPDGTPPGLTSIPISVTAYFSASSTTARTYYLVAYWGGTSATGVSGDTIEIRQPALHCEYKVYAATN